MTTPSPYRILGIPLSATTQEVLSAYRRALEERTYSGDEVKAAFRRLQQPTVRASQDLREPDTDHVLAELRDQIAAEIAAPAHADEPPSWRAVIDPETPGWRPKRREVPAPTTAFRSAELLAPPTAADLPVEEFRLR